MADCKKCGNENDSNACDKCEDKSVNSTVNDAVNAVKEKMENVLNTKDSKYCKFHANQKSFL